MKANQAYKADEEAVSPVVGVILMVAITVVLAAVVFVLVNNLGKGSEKAPSVGASADTTGAKININTAESGHTWGEFNIKSTKAVYFDLNGAATSGDEALVADTAEKVDATATPAAVTGGDYIAFCGDTTVQTNVVVQLIHIATNTKVYEATFPTIAVCT